MRRTCVSSLGKADKRLYSKPKGKKGGCTFEYEGREKVIRIKLQK